MSKFKKLSHVIYYHVYHIVWTPKYRYRVLTGQVADLLRDNIRSLCEWKRVEIKEMNIRQDHVHIVVSVEPKLSISQLMRILKGKTAIKIFRSYPGLKEKPYWESHFWSRGYCSSTVGLDEDQIRKYVKYQEEEEKKAEAQQQTFEF